MEALGKKICSRR